jgi:hypothetical protein
MDELERYRLGDVQVILDRNGKVFVNEVLCAEITVPLRYGDDLPQIRTRDDLARDLTLHRISTVALGRVSAVIHYLEVGSSDGPVTMKDRPAIGAAMIAGLLGESHRTDTRWDWEGHAAGSTLRAMRDHLQAETGAPLPSAKSEIVDVEDKLGVRCPFCAIVLVPGLGSTAAHELRDHLIVKHCGGDDA